MITADALIDAITTFLAGRDKQTLAAIRADLDRLLSEAGDEALRQLNERLTSTGADWTYYPSDPLARRIHHAIAERLLQPDSAIIGLEHLHALGDKRVVIFANHLSYADANLLEILLCRAKAQAFADRLTVMAGPKVYSSLKRKFSSLCFGTIKTPQSSSLSSEEAVMNTREVARAARQSIDTAQARIRLGDALLVFAEGTRSRSTGLQPMLPAVTRYLDVPDVRVLPVGIVGTEALFPIGDDALHPVRIDVCVGPPIDVEQLRTTASGDRRVIMDTVGRAIANLLPNEYRGAYDTTM